MGHHEGHRRVDRSCVGAVVTQLVRYDEACRALADARAVDEVKDIRDKAIALKEYARLAQNKQLEVDAAEIRFRSERRLGEMLSEQKVTVGMNQGAKGSVVTGTSREPVKDTRPTLSEVGIDKKLSSRAQKLAAVPSSQFEGMINDWRRRVSEETERVTTNLLREGERAQRDSVMPRVEIPTGRYGVVYADPPWRYEHVKTESRAIENNYPTMTLEEIKALPVPAADDSVLFMWSTSPKLAEAMEVITAWGYTYRSCMVWDKELIGMGYYWRQQHELLLLAIRGSPGTPDESARMPSIFRARRGEHSVKPLKMYELIERMYPDMPRIELFARNPHEGWATWGNEVARTQS